MNGPRIVRPNCHQRVRHWRYASDSNGGRRDPNPMARPSPVSVFVVGSGPSELHAHIDLERRLVEAGAGPATVLDIAHCDGHWSVVAVVSSESPA